jgi:hypothetical protein
MPPRWHVRYIPLRPKAYGVSTANRPRSRFVAVTFGVRTDRTREVIATYVDRIVVWPSQKRGEMWLNPAAKPLYKDHGRPCGRSWSSSIGATSAASEPQPADGPAIAFTWGRDGVTDVT